MEKYEVTGVMDATDGKPMTFEDLLRDGMEGIQEGLEEYPELPDFGDDLIAGLTDAASNIEERIVEMRRNVPKAYNLRHAVNQATKHAIDALCRRDALGYLSYMKDAKEGLESLQALNIPRVGGMKTEFVYDASQEYAEAYLFAPLLQRLVGAPVESTFLSCDDMGIDFQPWLGGLIDAAGELEKYVQLQMMSDGVTRVERARFQRSLVAISTQVVKFASRFRNHAPNLVNASSRRGQGFHAKLGRKAQAVRFSIDALNLMMYQNAPTD